MSAREDEEKRREHFRNALSNYAPIIAQGEGELGKQLEKADEGLSFPSGPADILDYLGNIDPLNLTEDEECYLRSMTQRVINKKGAQYVWDSRFLLKLEFDYINNF